MISKETLIVGGILAGCDDMMAAGHTHIKRLREQWASHYPQVELTDIKTALEYTQQGILEALDVIDYMIKHQEPVEPR